MPDVEFKFENGDLYVTSKSECTLPTCENGDMPIDPAKPFSIAKKRLLVCDAVTMLWNCFMVYLMTDTIIWKISHDINCSLVFEFTLFFAFIFLTIYMLLVFMYEYKQGE